MRTRTCSWTVYGTNAPEGRRQLPGRQERAHAHMRASSTSPPTNGQADATWTCSDSMTGSWKRTDHRAMDGRNHICATFRAQGAADVFLETERKDCCRVRSRGARAGGGVVFLHTDVHEAGGGASGVSDQTVSGYGGCATIPGMRMPSPSRPYRWGRGVARWNCACPVCGRSRWRRSLAPAPVRCIIG